MRGAKLTYTNLWSRFERSQSEGADLRGGDLFVRLSGVDLIGADLSGADLSWTFERLI